MADMLICATSAQILINKHNSETKSCHFKSQGFLWIFLNIQYCIILILKKCILLLAFHPIAVYIKISLTRAWWIAALDYSLFNSVLYKFATSIISLSFILYFIIGNSLEYDYRVFNVILNRIFTSKIILLPFLLYGWSYWYA